MKGVYTISYHSADEIGNVEETKQVEVKIDRTPPTARIGFDPETRMIVAFDPNGQSEVTVGREEEDISPKRRSWGGFFSWIPAQPSMRRSGCRNDKSKIRVKTILTDEAGHITDVVFAEERKYGTSFTLSDFSVSQDGKMLETSGMYASYQIISGRWGQPVPLSSGRI